MLQGVNQKKFINYIFLLSSLFFLSACVKEGKLKGEREIQILRNRIDEYWNYVIKGEIEKAYNFEHPKYREKISILKYLNRFKIVKYENYELMDIKIESNRGEVEIEINQRYMVKHFMDKNIKKKIIDRWVKSKDNWFHIPEGFDIKE